VRKSKSRETFKERLDLIGSRKPHEFDIGPNSHPSKVARWLKRGGGSPLLRSAERIAADHVHPRRDRVAACEPERLAF
jgi:hypothetical protein